MGVRLSLNKLSSIIACLGLLTACVPVTQVAPLSPGTLTPSLSAAPPTGLATRTLAATIPPTALHTAQPGSATPQAAPETQVPSSPTPAANRRTHYLLDAVFDYYQHSLSVAETIRYVNTAPEALNDLTLVVEPNLWPGGFSLVDLTRDNGPSLDNVDLQEDQMVVPLAVPLEPGAEITLNLSYSLSLPQIPPPSEAYRPQPYGYTSRQTNIVDWYPFIPPYQPGEGWLVHPGWAFGEHLVFDEADFEVSLTLSDPVQDLVMAASAPASQNGDTYTYHLEAGRSFALSASDAYQVETTQVDGVTVSSYFFPWDKASGREVLQNSADALQLYSRLLIPYPHTTLNVIEADFLDGMEYEGLFFLSHGFYDLYDGTSQGYLTFIAAHETAHQWWYGLVGNDQAMEPWLDEALCTYMEHIFYENVYAGVQATSGQSMLDWWWFYRVNYYEPSGWIDGAVYDFNRFRPYRDAVYLNGAKFLDDLRNLIGDEAFFAFLRDYARQNEYKIATAADFFTILRQHTDADLDELLARYFQNAR